MEYINLRSLYSRFFIAATLAIASLSMARAQEAKVDFKKEIRPILEFNCVTCHNEEKAKGELRMDDHAHFIQGGENGLAVESGQPDKSQLIHLVSLPEDDSDVMPPKGRLLTKEEIAKLRQWIAEGASWPEGMTLVAKDEADFREAIPLEDKGKKIVKVAAYPEAISLEKMRDFQSVVVMATYEDDTTLDVTQNATFTFADPSLVELAKRNRFLPAKNGSTDLTVAVGGFTVKIPVKVLETEVDRPVDFHLDIMPIFAAEGCDVGSCHGSARGQDGFMLSIFGYDPVGDHYRITREMAGHRINLAIPEESLLVEKSIEEVPHTGGKLFEKNSAPYKAFVEWITNGAKIRPTEEVPKVLSVELYPPGVVLEGAGATQQLTVRAKYSDGQDRDVTDLAVFNTNNEGTAAVTDAGLITAGKRGEAFVMARYDTHTVGIQAIVIPENLEYTKPSPKENNFIDQLVDSKLHKLRIIPSGDCTDEEFLRRISLDIVGLLPTPDEYAAFVADTDAAKRSKKIDELLERKEFTEMWVMKWSELLKIRSSGNLGLGISYKAALLYNSWLEEQISKNRPFNEIVVDLLSAEGGSFSNPATNFYQVEKETLKLSENVAQIFMGMRLQCAQCHNHPFDRWTMDDYYSWAAFFAQVGRKEGVDPREQVVFNRGGGEVKHLVGGRNMEPKFLGGEVPDVAGKDRRKVLAEWLASPENEFFSRNIVNITWSHFFGIGIIEPVDDVRISNPPSNPELLDALADRFQGEYHYDFRRLVRDICNSATYQRTTLENATNKDDLNNFAKARIRRQRAEVMLDTISQVTETKNKFTGLPLGARAVQIADGNTTDYFLTTFGRATRETVCSCEVKMDPNLSQALHLLNGPTVGQKIEQGAVVKHLLAQGKTPAQIIEEIYVRSISRKPTADEATQILAQVKAAAGDDKAKEEQALNDVFWAVLNSKEFMFNH